MADKFAEFKNVNNAEELRRRIRYFLREARKQGIYVSRAEYSEGEDPERHIVNTTDPWIILTKEEYERRDSGYHTVFFHHNLVGKPAGEKLMKTNIVGFVWDGSDRCLRITVKERYYEITGIKKMSIDYTKDKFYTYEDGQSGLLKMPSPWTNKWVIHQERVWQERKEDLEPSCLDVAIRDYRVLRQFLA